MPRTKNEIIEEGAEGEPKQWVIGDAVYELAGLCAGCGVEVFQCITHPVRMDEVVGLQLACFVPSGKNVAVVYCQKCDPTKEQRARGINHKPGDPIPMGR